MVYIRSNFKKVFQWHFSVISPWRPLGGLSTVEWNIFVSHQPQWNICNCNWKWYVLTLATYCYLVYLAKSWFSNMEMMAEALKFVPFKVWQQFEFIYRSGKSFDPCLSLCSGRVINDKTNWNGSQLAKSLGSMILGFFFLLLLTPHCGYNWHQP